jgi:hypothetical protein
MELNLMIPITCETTLRHYGWCQGWYVPDGDRIGDKSQYKEKLKWLDATGLWMQCAETMGGWSFKTEQGALQFTLTWS